MEGIGGKEIPFDENKVCDLCRVQGAFDFNGDYCCSKCMNEIKEKVWFLFPIKERNNVG